MLLLKMVVRLLLTGILERVSGVTSPPFKDGSLLVRSRVVCGSFELQFGTHVSGRSLSASTPRKPRKPKAVAASTSTATTQETMLLPDASFSPGPAESGSYGRGLEP